MDSNDPQSHVVPRQRKLRSAVWNDFTKELKKHGSDIAICNHCKRKFKGSSSSGTTHLRNHLRSCVSYAQAKDERKDIVGAQPVELGEDNFGTTVEYEVGSHVLVFADDIDTDIHGNKGAIVIHENANNWQSPHVTPVIRQRKLRSPVWNDFTKETRADGSLVAVCNHCRRQMTGASNSGTTHLKKHLAKCMFFKRAKKGKQDLGQLVQLGKKQRGPERSLVAEELFHQNVAHMIILHEYPFSIVNHIGFRTFVKNLQPHFNLLSPDVLQENCMKIYESKRQTLYKELNGVHSSISLTADIWSSRGNLNYLCLSCHFIDNDWKMQHKVINFWHMDSPHEAETANLIFEKLLAWHIEGKVSSIVLDSSTTSNKVVQELLRSLREKNPLILDGDLFHVYPCSHVLNLIIQGGLEETTISKVINKIRDSVTFVRASPARLERFQTVAKHVGVPKESLVADSPSEWKSTYLMVATAYEFRDVLLILAESENGSMCIPSSAEWDDVRIISECLRTFYLMVEKDSLSKYPTANLCFHSICGIHLSLKSWCISSHLLVSSMAKRMLELFEKYWGVTSTVVAAASILDPRYKMKSMEYFFKLLYTKGSEAEVKIENALHAFRSLHNAYALQLDKLLKSSHGITSKAGYCIGSKGIANGVPGGSPQNAVSDLQFGLDRYVQETSLTQLIKSDLDLYLEEPVYPLPKVQENDDFDILAWWKTNASKYPILSAIARDFLGIPMSIASPEPGFSSKAKVLSCYHRSMDPVILQGLICAQSWLRDEIEGESADRLATIFTASEFDEVITGFDGNSIVMPSTI